MRPICGPKLSICCALLSTWGVVMLLVLGGLFRVNAVAFVEDVSTNWTNQTDLKAIYKSVSNNCFFAAAGYLLFLVFSAWQYKLGSSGHFQVS